MNVEILTVDVIHLFTFCWAISRAYAGRGAWKPNRLDLLSGAIALFSYIILVTSSFVNRQWVSLAEDPLLSLALFLVMASVYIALILLSIAIRRSVYRRAQPSEIGSTS